MRSMRHALTHAFRHDSNAASKSCTVMLTSDLALQIEAEALKRIMTALDSNQPARSVQLTVEETAAVKPLYLLTMKPMIYAANVPEDDLADVGAANKHVQTMRAKAAKDDSEVIIVSAQVSLISHQIMLLVAMLLTCRLLGAC